MLCGLPARRRRSAYRAIRSGDGDAHRRGNLLRVHGTRPHGGRLPDHLRRLHGRTRGGPTMREMEAAQLRAMEATGRHIAAAIERACKTMSGSNKWGFALMIFSFDGPEFTWISNAQRADMVKAMQEFISRNPPDQVSADRS